VHGRIIWAAHLAAPEQHTAGDLASHVAAAEYDAHDRHAVGPDDGTQRQPR
jgi:hypothetical protein